MSERDDEYEARRARDFADRIHAAGVRHGAMKRAAKAPTGTPETTAAVDPSPMTPEEIAEVEALLPPDLWDGRSSALALCSEDERGVLSSVVLGLLRRARAAEAIVAGRTTPPTDAEIYAHDARGGAWLVTLPPRAQVRMMPETRYTSDPAEVSRLWWSEGAWWVPVLHGRPCAWPTVGVPRG